MKKICLSLICAFLICCLHAQDHSIKDKRLASLDTAFQRVLKTWNAPGFAVAVVEKNKIIYAKGFGFRDMEKKLPVTPNTIFAIGSCTKSFTTSLMGILQKEGKLDIDKPAHQYLPELNFFSPELTSQVTPRDMMSHRTGLPRHDYSWYLFSTGTRDSLIKKIQFQEPTFPIRRQWQYNNLMFVSLGVIAEKLTGKAWEENIREKIFTPLNMNESRFSFKEFTKNNNVALGYGLKNDSLLIHLPYYEINTAGPAGSINSNVMEMSNWIITWINGGKFNNKEVLPENFVRDAISSQSIIDGGLPYKEKPGLYFLNYGLGWVLSSYKGHYRVEHGGNIDGFSANTSFFPTDSIGIIVLTNQDKSSIPSIVRNLVADRLLQLPYFDWNTDLRIAYDKAIFQEKEAQKTRTSAQKKGTHPSHALQDHEGIYTHPGYGSFDVFTRNDSVFASISNKTLWLKHYHYDVFTPYLLDDPRSDTSETGTLKVQFITGLNGEIESMRTFGLEASTIELEFKKTPREKPVSKEKMEEYTGSYEIAGAEIRYYLKGDKLIMFIEGQPEYEMIPIGKDQFTIKILTGYSVQFLRDDKNGIIAVNLIQPNGTFKANRKK